YKRAPIRLAFLTQLPRTASLATRMDQLNAVGIHDGEEARLGQKRQRILGAVAQEPLSARALGQLGREGAIIGIEPAVKGAEATAFQGKEQPDGDNLARIQMGIGTLIDMTQFVVYHAKQADDQLVRWHTVLLVMCAVHPHHRGRLCFLQVKPTAEST